ncbi:MAG: septum formation initiator family protein [Vicinamibacterales bacterium]
MATRHTIKTESTQRAQRLGRRILAGLFFLVVCVLVVDALVGDQGVMATIRARKQYDELVSDLARLRDENASLREEARRLREDPEAIEEIARRELGLMSPGEKLFIIRDVEPPAGK